MSLDYHGRILIVDDDEHICGLLAASFEQAGFRVEVCHHLDGMKGLNERYSFEVVLLDLYLGDESGFDGLSYLAKEAPFSKVIVLTADNSVDSAVEVMRQGATDYIVKGTDPSGMIEKVKKHLSASSQEMMPVSDRFSQIGLIGQGKGYVQLCETIDQVKDVDTTLLILGESGTGKEVVARAIHQLSSRRAKRFEAINCAAIPEHLLESELFGHKRGAFTDARADRKGIFELCSDGTLLLDEIGDMPINLQAKLLRVLQEKEIVPIGSSQSIKINTRVIAATHRDLLEEIQSGNFREDLYFRLSIVPVQIPPLRHRKDDIRLLTSHFVEQFNQRFQKTVAQPSPEVMQRLMSYDWPGNVRELRNAIERAMVLSRNDELHKEHLFYHLQVPGSMNSGEVGESQSEAIDASIFNLPLTDAKQAFEKAYVEKLLVETQGNIAELARRCGRYRADIYRLFEKYGIDHTSYR